jgi:hypothetical protein
VADVYSLGATTIFLLTGETILPGCPDIFALERRRVPRELQQVLVDATVSSPQERTRTAQAFLDQLDREFEKFSRSRSILRDVSHEGRETSMGHVAAHAPSTAKEAVSPHGTTPISSATAGLVIATVNALLADVLVTLVSVLR